MALDQEKLNNSSQIWTSINTDDQGVFDIKLENEYALIARALERKIDENGNPVPLVDLQGKFIRGNGSTTINHGSYGNTTHTSAALGITQGDTIRNIDGTIGSSWSSDHATLDFLSGAFSVSTYNNRGDVPSYYLGGLAPQIANFNASRVVPTANENRPINMSMNYIIKY